MNVEDVMPVAEMPRTVEELRAFTRFRLKAMMRKAGMLDDSATEAAIVSLPIGAMAERLAEHLAHLDGAKMPAKAAPATPSPAPVMAPPPAPTPAPEVTEAAPPKRGRPAKNPRPPTEVAPAQAVAPSVPPPPPAAPAPAYGAAADYSGQFEKIHTEIAALRTLVTSMRAEVLNTIAASNSHAGSCGHEMKAKLDVIQEMAKFSQALSLFFAEETLGGGREEIVRAAIGDAEAIDNMVGKARGR